MPEDRIHDRSKPLVVKSHPKSTTFKIKQAIETVVGSAKSKRGKKIQDLISGKDKR